MKLLFCSLLLISALSLGLIEKCSKGQPCSDKWTYTIPSSQLSKPLTFSSDSKVLFTLLNPKSSDYRNPTSQVATLPYSYELQGKDTNCPKTKVCCSGYSYAASEDTVGVYSVGSTLVEATLGVSSPLDSTSKIQTLKSISNSTENGQYKIVLQTSDPQNQFTNKYLLRRTSNVTKEMAERPLLIPQSFYKTSYQCQFLGRMDTTVCNSKCSYVMTISSLNDSDLYALPDDSYYQNGTIFSPAPQFNISITIYNISKPPSFGPVISNVTKIVSQTILLLKNSYCINLSLLNPTNQSALSNLAISTPASNVYQNSLLFQQYQALNVSVCSPETKYSVVLDGEGYDYEYVQPEENPRNETISENTEKECRGVCKWWIWVVIGLGGAVLVLGVFCVVKGIYRRVHAKKILLQTKLKQLAGVKIPTNPSLTTLSDLTAITQRHPPRHPNSLNNSRRALVSPRHR